MMMTVALLGVLPGLICLGLGYLTRRPWIVFAIMVLIALPLAFFQSPLGPIGPAMFALAVAGLLIGAIVAWLLRRVATQTPR
jgi:hypothetical protein